MTLEQEFLPWTKTDGASALWGVAQPKPLAPSSPAEWAFLATLSSESPSMFLVIVTFHSHLAYMIHLGYLPTCEIIWVSDCWSKLPKNLKSIGIRLAFVV